MKRMIFILMSLAASSAFAEEICGKITAVNAKERYSASGEDSGSYGFLAVGNQKEGASLAIPSFDLMIDAVRAEAAQSGVCVQIDGAYAFSIDKR